MTRILHIPTGNFVPLESSIAWDRAHMEDDGFDMNVLDIEDSYAYSQGRSVKEIFEHIVAGTTGNKDFDVLNVSELELVYDKNS